MATQMEARTTRDPRESSLPENLLEIYMREARSHELLTPEQEKALLQQITEARDHATYLYLATEPALAAVWEDLERWRAGDLAALSLIPGPPKEAQPDSGPTLFATRLHRIFLRAVRRNPRRPFAAKKVRARLVRTLLFIGLRPGPLDRYRTAAIEKGGTKVRAAIEKAERRFLDVRQPIIERNLRLVMKLARKFVPGLLSYAELIQEGNLGLIRATESYSHRFGVRFSTYAYLWIRQSILRALENKSRTIRLPVNLTQALRKMENSDAVLDPTLPGGEKAREEWRSLLANPTVGRPLLSLDQGLEDDQLLGQTIADPSDERPQDQPLQNDTAAFVRNSLQELPDRQRLILRLRFGIDCPEPLTLTEIARLLGVSAERVRQIQQQAIKSLRESEQAGSLLESWLD